MCQTCSRTPVQANSRSRTGAYSEDSKMTFRLSGTLSESANALQISSRQVRVVRTGTSDRKHCSTIRCKEQVSISSRCKSFRDILQDCSCIILHGFRQVQTSLTVDMRSFVQTSNLFRSRVLPTTLYTQFRQNLTKRTTASANCSSLYM